MEFRERIVQDGSHDVARLFDGEHGTPVNLERRLYLLAGLAARQPAGSSLGRDIPASTGGCGQGLRASLKDGLPEKRVAGGQKYDGRVGSEGQRDGPPD